MQAPQRACLVVVRDVALHHIGIESVLGEFGGAERPRKEAAIIDVWCEIDDRHAVDFGRGELQLGSFQKSCASIWPVFRRYSICLSRVCPRPWNVAASMSMLRNTLCSCAAPSATFHSVLN